MHALADNFWRHNNSGFWRFVVFVLCAGVLLNPSAYAVDVDVGALTGTSFAQAYTYAPDTVINDVFSFDLSETSSFSADVTQFSLPYFFGINNLSLTLTPPTGPNINFLPDSTGTIIQTGVQILPAGYDYSLAVSGNVNGALGGGYAVLLAAGNLSALPVPEPVQWQLLLLGAIAIFLIVALRPQKRV